MKITILLCIVTWASVLAGCRQDGAVAQPSPAAPLDKNFPLIQEYGGIWIYPQAAYRPSSEATYQIILDVTDGPPSPDQHLRQFEKAARIYNLLTYAGVPLTRIRMVLVVHEEAILGTLSNEVYRERFAQDNPNLEVIRRLKARGAVVVLCSQTLGKHKLAPSDIATEVELALSAATTILHYQAQGYRVLPT